MIIGWEGITQASDPVRYSFLTSQGIYPEEWYVSMVVLVALWVAFEAGAGIALIVYGSNLWKSSGTSTAQSHDGAAADEGAAGGSEKISKKAKSIKPPAVAGMGELV